MRAILIDPILHTFTLVQHDGNYRQIYKWLSDSQHGLKVSTFDAVRIDARNSVFVDDEGLTKNPRYFFKLKDYAQPLAGRGLVLGVNHSGESCSTSLTLTRIRKLVRFAQLSVQGVKTSEGTTTFMGQRMAYISSEPIFGPPEGEEEKKQ
jgi:aspartyl aminopeptidase